jgi:hypothetical protein
MKEVRVRRPLVILDAALSPSGDKLMAVHSTGPNRSRLPYTVVSTVFALVLLIAAGLKAQALLSQTPLHAVSNWVAVGSWAELIAEWALAAWLLSGLAAVSARRATIGLLSAFLIVAGWHLLAGDRDCGCFGRFAVHPAWTSAIDCIALVAICVIGRVLPTGGDRRMQWHRRTMAIGVAAALPCAVFLVVMNTSAVRSQVATLDESTSLGRIFPILAHLDPKVRTNLSRGRRTIILIDRHCPRCMDSLQRMRATGVAGVGATTYAIDIAIPRGVGEVPDFHSVVPLLTLQDDTEFAAEVPLQVSLIDAVVVDLHPL